MGNQNTTQNHIDFTDIATNYTYDVKYSDNRFGEVKLLKRKVTGERIFQKDFSTNSSQEFDAYINRIKDRLPLLHPNLIKVLGYNAKKEDLFCADFFKISLFFESFESDLEKEIFKRKESGAHFPETELRWLLDCMIAVGAFLQRKGIYHGDFRPYNIFITKNKEYKVCDSTLFSASYNPAYYNILDGLEARNHYPSPQVFGNKSKGKNTNYDAYKNDVYGLGASVLMAAKLGPINDAYNYDKRTINQDYINQALEGLHEHYSDSLIDALRLLLHPDECDRPSFIELDDAIKGRREDLKCHANLERSLDQQRHRLKHPEHEVRNAPPQYENPNNIYYDDELDKKVRAAIMKSEEKANNSPAKYHNEVIDNTIQTYLRKEPLPQDQPLLYHLAPHLTLQDRFVPTLKVYSNNPGVENPDYYQGNVLSASVQRPPTHNDYDYQGYGH